MSVFAYMATLKLTVFDVAIHDELQREVTRTPQRVLVHAPYAAWMYAHRQLRANVYGPRGGKRPYGKTAGFKALQVITKEINYVDSHPAMSGLAMFDIHYDIFPAWVMEHDDRFPAKYSPYPQPGHQFVILSPRWQQQWDKPKLTWWVPSLTGEGRLAEEQTHLRLWRESSR